MGKYIDSLKKQTSDYLAVEKNKNFVAAFGGLFLILLLLIAANLIPSVKEKIFSLLVENERLVLNVAEADITGNNDWISVVKVKTVDSLSLEIYDLDRKTQNTTFKYRVILPDKKDGYFNYHGNAANLAFEDLDGDRVQEIIAPTFDNNLIPRLNIYKYDPSLQVFVKLNSDSIKL